MRLEPHTPRKRAGKLEVSGLPSHFMGGVQVALFMVEREEGGRLGRGGGYIYRGGDLEIWE